MPPADDLLPKVYLGYLDNLGNISVELFRYLHDLPQIAANADYFVVTAKNQMSDQLEDYLSENYAVFAQGPGYLIFDLKATP